MDDKIEPVKVAGSEDLFISDCLLSTTRRKHKYKLSEIYPYYIQYCEYAGIIPETRHKFGRVMTQRFQFVHVQGRKYYLCEFNPRVLKGGQ